MMMQIFLRLLPFALLAACSAGPDYVRPALNLPSQFKEANGWKPAQPRDQALPGKWWEIFKDPQLNALEEQVAAANPSIAQAEAQYRQAQHLVNAARAAYFPTGTATATVNRFRAASGTNVAVPGVRYLYGLALSVAWEPDLWGSVRRQVESDIASAQASAATLQALKLSTQATLAQDYFQLRMLDAQKKLLDETVAAYDKNLALTQNRYAVGVAAKTEVVQAETQLQSTRAQAIDLGVQRAQMEHAIAILAGKTPAELSLSFAPLNSVPPPLPPALPSELLERRPDIASAERKVAAANATIGVAKAAFFPSLNLAATNGYQTNSLSNLFSKSTRYWALGPSVAAETLFEGGAKNAQLRQNIDAFDASVAAYRQTVLTGFQEVEDSLAALRILEDESQTQGKAVQAARESLAMTNNQYKAGTVSYLNVIVAQAAALSNEKTAVQIQGERLTAAVGLVKALGGSWNVSSLPGPEEAGGAVEWRDYLPYPVE
jgi:NodT family efflux transporter outer membrane factor (OMF) lipoprotein